MRPLSVTVTRNERIVGRLSRLSLASDVLGATQPGQWVAITRPDARAILGQPFPLGALDPRTGQADIFYCSDLTGSGGISHHDAVAEASWLATLSGGDSLDVLGPWGRPFPISTLARHVVVLGSGTRLFGLLALATALVARGDAVVVLHDASTAADLVPPSLLPPAAEYHVATLDGSAGSSGVALDLLPPLLRWADAVYAALPPAEYLTLRDLVHRHRLRVRRGYATVLAEAPLACYAGACDCCGVPLREGGYALLCKDGPAFDLLNL